MKNIITIALLLLCTSVIAQKYVINSGVKMSVGRDTTLYVIDSLSNVDKSIIPISATIYLKEAGKEGLFTPAVNQSAIIDDAIIIADGIGTRFKRVFEHKDGVNPEWFGATLGQLKSRYSTKTYSQLNSIRYNNLEALQAAFTYSVVNSTYTKLTDTLEIWGGFPNTFTVSDNQKLVFKGTSLKAYVDLYPKYYHNQAIFRLLTVNEGANIEIDGVTFNGREYETYFQTYTAILKPSGNTTQIDIPDSVSIWSGFWSSLQTGDTLFYARNTTTTGYFGIISSIDSTTRLITLNADLNAAVSSDHVGIVGCYWKEQEISNSDITTYGKKWMNQASLSNFLYSGIGASVITNEGVWRLNNVRNTNYKQGLSVAGGNIAGYFTNCYIQSHEIGMSRFTGDGGVGGGNPSIWEFRNLELTGNGFYQDGGMVHQGGVTAGNIWGSGAYLHPTAIVRVYDSYIHDNAALAFRQYSSSGARTAARDAYSVFDGVRFTNNGEKNLLLSNSMPNIVKNCRFEIGTGEGGISLGASTTFENCYINDAVLSYSESTPNVAIWNTLSYKFNNCVFDSLGRIGFQSGSWSSALFSKVDLSVVNCIFILDNGNAEQKISTTSTAIGFNMLAKDLVFKSLSRLTKDSLVQSMFQAPSGGRLIIDNISVTGGVNWNTSVVGNNATFAGGGVIIRNSNLPIRAVGGTTGTYYQKFIEIEESDLPAIYEFRTATRVKNFKKGIKQGFVATTATSNSNWGSVITYDKVLKIKPTANTFYVDADTVKSIMLVQDTIVGGSFTTMLNSLFEGEITIIAQRDMTFVPDAIYSKSNIKGSGYIPLKKGEVVTFKSLPNNTICTSESTDTITLATADGVKTTFNIAFPADLDVRTAPFIPYTTKLVAGAVELPLDYNFYGSNADVTGWISNYFTGYSFTFAVAPANTTPIQIITKSCVSPQWRGYFVVK